MNPSSAPADCGPSLLMRGGAVTDAISEEPARHSLPVSPFDNPRCPLSPLGDGNILFTGTPRTIARIESMGVWDLRQMIRQYGMNHADCDGVPALRTRAMQALSRARQSFDGDKPAAAESKRTVPASVDGGCTDGSGGGGIDPASDGANNRPCRRNDRDSFKSPSPAKHASHRNSTNHSSLASCRLAATPDPAAEIVLNCDAQRQPAHEVPRRRSLTLMAPPPPPPPTRLASGPLSPRMHYRLQCCAEEAHLEVECAAEDIDWDYVPNGAAAAVLLNTIYLSEFIPSAVIAQVCATNAVSTGILQRFAVGYAQCFQAIFFLLQQRVMPTPAAIRSALDTGEVLQGVLPDDLTPCHAVFYGAGGKAEFALDACLRVSQAEYGEPWWEDDAMLSALPEEPKRDGDYARAAKVVGLSPDFRRYEGLIQER